jgi:hypothetical protein
VEDPAAYAAEIISETGLNEVAVPDGMKSYRLHCSVNF